MGKKYFLLLIDSGIVVKKLPLVKGYYVIGRADDADLIISNKDISRHHAAVNYDAGACESQGAGQKCGMPIQP